MKRSNRGFTLVEIMIVVAIIALLAAIAIPNVLRGRTTANETAAIGNTRALVSSLEMFRSVNNRYPTTAQTWQTGMYEVDCAVETAPTPDFGPPSFCKLMDGTNAAAGGLTQGYLWTYANPDAAGGNYTLRATPQTVNNTGTRSFFADESGIIRHCTTVTQGTQATAASLPVDQPVNATCP